MENGGGPEAQERNYMNKALDDVTRFEVIDENGRTYSRLQVEVELSYQDDGRTLKVFVTPIDTLKTIDKTRDE